VEVVSLINELPTSLPLAGPANRQGRTVAQNMLGDSVEFTGVVGVGICKVFGLTVAAVGFPEKFLPRENTNDYGVIYLHPKSRTSYYVGGGVLHIKAVYNKNSGKIWGVQIIGTKGVDKRIDTISTAIQMGGTIWDLANLELAYAPPYNTPKDPINYIGWIAENIKAKHVKLLSPLDLSLQEHHLIDIREDTVFSLNHINGAYNIPLENLRQNLSQIPKDKKLVVYCHSGSDSYNAARVLSAHGYNVYNLNGGFITYKYFNFTPAEVAAPLRVASLIPSNIVAQMETLSLCGICCPGPIIKLQKHFAKMKPGVTIRIEADDSGFFNELSAWAENPMAEFSKSIPAAPVAKAETTAQPVDTIQKSGRMLLVTTDDLARVVPAFMAALTAAALGEKVTIFYIFDGIALLAKDRKKATTKHGGSQRFGKGGYFQRWNDDELPKHEAGELANSPELLIINIPEYIQNLQATGVKMIACSMAMGSMGLAESDLVDNLELAGMMRYVSAANEHEYNLIV